MLYWSGSSSTWNGLILIDPRKEENKDIINYYVKYRDP